MWWSSAASRQFAGVLRAASRTLAALAGVAMLGACGFQLRGVPTYAFATVYLNTPADSTLAHELKRAIEGSGGARVVDTAAAADVILDVPVPVDVKSVLSLSGGGRVREYALTKRVSYRLHDAKERDWLPLSQVVLYRSYTYGDAEALAREYAEVRMLQEMQGDAIQQIVRRLQAAKPPSS